MSPLNLLYDKVGIFRIFSLSVYGKFLTLCTNFVALFCALSMASISFLNLGFQTMFPYSRCGLIKVLYNFLKDFRDTWRKVLLIKPVILFALFIELLIHPYSNNKYALYCYDHNAWCNIYPH